MFSTAKGLERVRAIFRDQAWECHTLLTAEAASRLDTLWGDVVDLSEWAELVNDSPRCVNVSVEALIMALDVHMQKELPFRPLDLGESEVEFLLRYLKEHDSSPSVKLALESIKRARENTQCRGLGIILQHLVPGPNSQVAPRTSNSLFTIAEAEL